MNEEIILNECMDVKKGEKLLIVFDKNKQKIAGSIFNKAKELGFNVNKIETKVAKENAEEPPEEVAKEMLNYDVILLTTTKSLSHTKARRNATSKGARIASMPNITEDIMSRMDVDYKKMGERIKKIEDVLAKGNKIKIITEKGTDIIVGIGMTGTFNDTGIYTNKGDFGNLPAGEASILPKDTQGVFVVDATFAGAGKLDGPIKVTVKDNYAVKIEGGKAAKRLLEVVDQFGKDARNIAEFAFGTNDKAKITGITLEDEKVLGTVHLALGDNKTFGGDVDVPLHLDGVFLEPTVFIDDKKIMEKGKLIC